MSEATVRASLKTILQAVSNIGQVHDYVRFASDWTAYLGLFKTTISGSDVIRGWTITSTAEGREGWIAGGSRDTYTAKTHTFIIRGYLGLDDSASTEKTARALVETVMDALDNGSIITGNVINASLSQLTTFEPRVFGDVLCHYAEISQQVLEHN